LVLITGKVYDKHLNLNKIKSIAFIAHDNKKYELLEWDK